MEGINFSMSKIVHKITVPVRKGKKSKSISNLLKLPEDGSGALQCRPKSASTSNVGKVEKKIPKIDGPFPNCQSSDLVHPCTIRIEKTTASDTTFNKNHIHENDHSKIRGKSTQKGKKKVPPKRPPPPKFNESHYQVYANIFRSRSESEVTGSVYANYQDDSERFQDLFLYENDIRNVNTSGSDKDLGLHVYENDPSKTVVGQSEEDWYIYMANDTKVDDSDYVVMSPDRSLSL
ncbi:uncharacterized protein LOC134251062 isoform X2 [Saccostrea cucullata]